MLPPKFGSQRLPDFLQLQIHQGKKKKFVFYILFSQRNVDVDVFCWCSTFLCLVLLFYFFYCSHLAASLPALWHKKHPENVLLFLFLLYASMLALIFYRSDFRSLQCNSASGKYGRNTEYYLKSKDLNNFLRYISVS